MATTNVKKLSAKTIIGNVRKEDDGILFQIFGAAVDLKGGESNFGTWEALKGAFTAIRNSDGEKFTSAVCFLPESAHDMVANKLKGSDAKQTVEFAFEIGRKENDSVATGYEYTVTSLIEAEPEADPIERLIAKVQAKQMKKNGAGSVQTGQAKTAIELQEEKKELAKLEEKGTKK